MRLRLATAIRQSRDRLKGQPQEREHSDAVFGGTGDRVPPARGAVWLAQGMEARRAEIARLGLREPDRREAGCAQVPIELGNINRFRNGKFERLRDGRTHPTEPTWHDTSPQKPKDQP
jgi:hypothetical protein